jgi:hypothetical protein
VSCHQGRESLNLGELAGVTYAQAPDFSASSRGWTDVPAICLQRGIRLRDQAAPEINLQLESYGQGTSVGQVTPSAVIDSVSSDTATVLANRYTSASPISGQADTAAGGFAAGDVVGLRNLDGSDAGSSGTQVVLSVSGNDIELDGDFTGALAANLVLEWVAYASAAEQQQTTGAYADQGRRYGEG